MVNNEKDLARLVGARHETEAAVIVAALADHGIRAVATGDFTLGFRAEAPGDVSVLVDSEDLERAKHALEEIRRESRSIDWSTIDTGDSATC